MGVLLSKPSRITRRDRAILDLKIQRDRLRVYQRKLEAVAQREAEIARTCVAAGDRRRALLALKKKKYQESLIEQTDAQLLNLETLTTQIEFAVVEQDVVAGLKAGHQVLEQLNRETDINAVEKLMEDTADAIAYQEEISDMLAGKLNTGQNDDVEDELDALLAEQLDAERLAAGPGAAPAVPVETVASDLPAVPTHALPDVAEPEPAKTDASKASRSASRAHIDTSDAAPDEAADKAAEAPMLA